MKTKVITTISLLVALLSVFSYLAIPLPFSQTPVTMQTLGILLIGLLLSPQYAAITVAIWIAMGAIGLPVFAKGTSGLATLFGPTGGYIFGFLACAVFVAWMRGKEPNVVRYSIVATIGNFIIIYTLGVLGLMLVAKLPLAAAITNGVLPFIVGDIIKIAIAVFVAMALQRSAKQYLI